MIDYDELAQNYKQHRRIHPHVLKKLMQISQLKISSKVLEIGCGTGNYINAIHKATHAACWGIDPSTQMLKEAKEQSPQITFERGHAEALPFERNFFDLVFSVDVLHHLDDLVKYFSEVFRILRPSGLICSVTDSEDIIRNRRPLAFYFPETISVDLQRYPSILVLRKRMENAGFRNLQQFPVEFLHQLTDIQAYRDKAFSCLRLISSEAYQKGIARMETDLRQGPIPANSRYLLLFGKKPEQILFV
jgi:ubiquinone/menaquinone biosynthesis C-methylase UbiE